MSVSESESESDPGDVGRAEYRGMGLGCMIVMGIFVIFGLLVRVSE